MTTWLYAALAALAAVAIGLQLWIARATRSDARGGRLATFLRVLNAVLLACVAVLVAYAVSVTR